MALTMKTSGIPRMACQNSLPNVSGNFPRHQGNSYRSRTLIRENQVVCLAPIAADQISSTERPLRAETSHLGCGAERPRADAHLGSQKSRDLQKFRCNVPRNASSAIEARGRRPLRNRKRTQPLSWSDEEVAKSMFVTRMIIPRAL